MNASPAHALRRHASFLATALACTVLFGWMVSFGTFAFVAEDEFGSFYDHQAAAWLHGRWDVPEPALSGEAFIVDGKVYGYFGPTPALLRLPLVIAGVGFAQTTRLFMVIDYIACLIGAYALLLLAARWSRPARELSHAAVALFTTSVGLGSTLFFLGSRAYVYHEAILCGAAFALWSGFGALRYLRFPASRWWLASLAGGVLAVHARPPIGLFALSLLGCVAVANGLVRRPARPRNEPGLPPEGGTTNKDTRRHIVIAALSALGIFSFNVVSYVKFRTFEGCPLHLNVQYTPEKLAVLGNRNFHLGNLRFNSDAYLLRPALRVNAHFPYVYREFLDRKKYPESRMAYRDQTLALPWAMPGLFALCFGGSALAAATGREFRRPLAVLWVAAMPAALAMLTAVAVTQRYTADFLPFMIAAAAFGVAAMDGYTKTLRVVLFASALTFGAAGAGITLALTLHHQREIVWGVPEPLRQEYQRWQRNIDRYFGVER